MDVEIEKYVKKQIQLQEQIKELFVEKKMLQDQICVLYECLSLEKVNRKISELENKQKILTSLESMVNNLRTDIEPLEYLKQVLQRQLMVSTLPTNDLNIEERKYSDSSLLTTNSSCAIETLDSLSDVSSEESIMILSDYDVVSDEEFFNNTEKPVENKVMYDEALLMASSVHSSLVDHLIPNIDSNQPLINISDQVKSNNSCLQFSSKNTVSSIDLSNKSEHLLELYDVVNELDLLNCNQNENIEIKCDKRKIKPILNEAHQPCIFDKELSDSEIKLYKNASTSVNDSWVKISPNEISNEQFVDIFQSITDSQKDNTVSKVKMDIDICEKNIDKIMSFDNSNNVDSNYEDEIQKPSSVENKIHVNLLPFTEDSNALKQLNGSKENLNVEIQGQNDHLYNHQFASKYNNEVMNYKNNCNAVIHFSENEINNPVCPYDKVKITPSLLFTEGSNVSKESNNLFTNINDKLSSINNNVKPILLCHTIDLKDELLNGIHQYGIQNLMPLQQECMSHCVNGRDVIFHSYPCVGKSTVCLISVLQRINTSLNECQAIVLVPTLELALSAQKTMKSIGKFLNVSTCIGGTNVPRKLSPVPHVVISTLQGLCEMINCNSLCKDFIKMLVIDDAEDMLKCNGFFNKIRYVLLFLNNNRQLIILSTSKIEEILDQFSDLMQNPEYILAPNEKPLLNDISQYCVYLPEEWKFDAFCELYEVLNLTHAVVYCNTWSKALEIAENMRLKTYLVSAVHNDIDTHLRNLILHQFQCGTNRVLVTAELQRGEDFSDVSWVINYDLPKSPKDYVRKIVGCFSRRVKVINFITTDDKTTKEAIETAFNVSMLNMPQDLTDLCVSNL